MSVERRILLLAFGAKIVLTPGPNGMKGAIAKAEELLAETPNGYMLQQFNNPGKPGDPPRRRPGRRYGTTRTARRTSWSPASARAGR